ncbi:hypothetical protein KI387_006654, partial [Taxus chinensis]
CLVIPHPLFGKDKVTMEMVLRPSVIDNIIHWKVFNDDNKLLDFLVQRDNFNNLFFEGGENPHREVVAKEDKEGIGDIDEEGVIKLKGNKIPKGLFSLEDIFDKNDRFIQEKEKQSSQFLDDFEKENVGTPENPRI